MAAHWKYLPILKWKQGERIALRELTPGQWTDLVPLVELLGIDAAPDLEALRAALPQYLEKIRKAIAKDLPQDKRVLVDIRWVSPSYPRQARLLSVVAKHLARFHPVLPVISETMIAREAADLARFVEFDEVCVRLRAPALDPTQISPLVDIVARSGIRRRAIHLVIDQYSIVNEQVAAKHAVIRPFLDAALACNCASVTLAGGSFPANLIGFAQGPHDLARVEWRIWSRVHSQPAYRAVLYSDYAVTNPGPLSDLDPMQMNPSVAIRYAASDFWRLYKAGGFKRGRPDQYRSLCQLLISDAIYSGRGFSYGDTCYDDAANHRLGNGNPSSWRRDATSHHLVFTSSQL